MKRSINKKKKKNKPDKRTCQAKLQPYKSVAIIDTTDCQIGVQYFKEHKMPYKPLQAPTYRVLRLHIHLDSLNTGS